MDEELTRRVLESIVEKLESGAASIAYMELVRVIYWGCLAMFVVSHAVHWVLGMWL